MRDENNFIISEKFVLNYADSLKLFRALGNKCTRSYNSCGQISYHHFFFGVYANSEDFDGVVVCERFLRTRPNLLRFGLKELIAGLRVFVLFGGVCFSFFFVAFPSLIGFSEFYNHFLLFRLKHPVVFFFSTRNNPRNARSFGEVFFFFGGVVEKKPHIFFSSSIFPLRSWRVGLFPFCCNGYMFGFLFSLVLSSLLSQYWSLNK